MITEKDRTTVQQILDNCQTNLLENGCWQIRGAGNLLNELVATHERCLALFEVAVNKGAQSSEIFFPGEEPCVFPVLKLAKAYGSF